MQKRQNPLTLELMQYPTPSSWIKVRDFIETAYWMTITSGSNRLPVAQRDQAELVEFLENGLILKLPKTACAIGHVLVIDILRTTKDELSGLSESPGGKALMKNPFGKKAPMLSSTGKVVELDQFNDDTNIVTVKFYQYDEPGWAEFLKHCNERQSAVNNLIKRIQE